MRNAVLSISATTGVILGWLIGETDTPILVLCTMMVMDYVFGLCVAGFTHKSNKSETGGLSSKASLAGLAKKFGMIGMIILAHQLDMALEMSVIRSGATYCLMANESLSIIENLGLLGVPYPNAVKNAIEILTDKEAN